MDICQRVCNKPPLDRLKKKRKIPLGLSQSPQDTSDSFPQLRDAHGNRTSGSELLLSHKPEENPDFLLITNHITFNMSGCHLEKGAFCHN